MDDLQSRAVFINSNIRRKKMQRYCKVLRFSDVLLSEERELVFIRHAFLYIF